MPVDCFCSFKKSITEFWWIQETAVARGSIDYMYSCQNLVLGCLEVIITRRLTLGDTPSYFVSLASLYCDRTWSESISEMNKCVKFGNTYLKCMPIFHISFIYIFTHKYKLSICASNICGPANNIIAMHSGTNLFYLSFSMHLNKLLCMKLQQLLISPSRIWKTKTENC